VGTESDQGHAPDKGARSAEAGEETPRTSTERATPPGHAASGPEQIEALLKGFMVCARMLVLYPPGHGRVTQKLGEILGLLEEFFAARREPLELTVAGHRLLAGESHFDQFSGISERFAVMLRHRQVRTLVLLPGIEEDELRLIVEVLRIDHRALLRVGGTRSFVDQRPHPHVSFQLYESGAGRPAARAAPADESGEWDVTATELAPFPAADRGPGPGRIVVDTAGNIRLPADMDEDAIADLEAQHASEQERFEQQLEEFALKDLLPAEDSQPQETVAFAVEADLLADDEVRACMEDDAHDIKQRFRRHSVEETSLRILFRLLSESDTELQYRQRRRMLLQAVRDPRFFTGELVHVVRTLVEDGGSWGYERGEELAQSVIAYVTDAAAVSQLLNSIPLVPEVAQGVLGCLVTRDDALPLLARLQTHELPGPVAEELPKTFVEAAQRDSHGFVQWALQDRKTVLRPTVVRTLLDSCPSILTTVAERLLLERPDRDRRKLLHLLCANGGESALRLLAHAVRSCGRGVSVEALEALGRFPHPLALEVLRDVVRRNNGEDFHREEAEAAIYSLHGLGIKEARAFLWEIVQSRRSLFSYAYVRPLRLIAESVLQGPETV
jgi:hypothetical protein